MAFSINNANDDLAGMLHGGTTNKVTNLLALHWRAGRNILSKIDALGTKRRTNLTTALFDDVFNYALPSDFKEAIDLRPQVNRSLGDNFTGRFTEAFDLRKALENNQINVSSNDGAKFIRIAKNITPAPITISAMDSLTGTNGEWTVVGSATNLAVNTIFFISNAASIEFDLVATGDGIQNTTLTAVDLSDHDEVSNIFVWVYIPDASKVTSVTTAWGNDLTTKFWTGVAQTTQHDGSAFRNGWNQISTPWATATETGTVDPSAIDSVSVVVAGEAQSNIRVDQITSAIGKIFELVYYSKFIFRDSSGAFIEKPTTDSDVLNLDEDAYNIYVNELAYLAAQQNQGEDARFDQNFLREELYGVPGKPGLYTIYNKKHPSERLRQRSQYYRIKQGR